jgi:2-haloalkanoic acid dehalogenase type II
MRGRFSDYEVMSFDCYGTLIDWESGIWAALQPLFTANRASPTRLAVLASYAELEYTRQAESPASIYPDILADVHRALASELGLETTEDLDRAFGESVPRWPAFPDSAEALEKLGESFRLVILSNVHRSGFEGSQRRLGVEFDAVYTAEEIGSYKPDPANFDYLLEHVATDFAVGPEAVLHVAQSLFHDHAPAKAAGLATAWIDRQRLSEGGSWGATKPLEERPTPDHVFYSLAELVEAVGAG